MKNMLKWLVFISMVVGLTTGAIQGISFSKTLEGMRSVAQGAPGTFILENASREMLLLAWPSGDGYWAFANLMKNGQPVKDVLSYGGGTRVDTMTMANFMADLEKDGWTQIAAGALPKSITNVLGSYVTYLVSVGVRALPEVFMVPLILVQPTPAVMD